MNWSEAVRLAKEGKEEGYNFLYEQTYQKSYYIALKYMKQEDAALDVLQEAYIKAFNSLDQLQDAEKFAGWFSRIVATKALDELKKRKVLVFSQLQTDDEDIPMEELMADERTDNQPELAIDKEETSRLVQEIIGTLSDEQRICIMMFYIEEIPVKEIAQILNVSENTVKSRLKYGRKNIEGKVLELEKKGTKLYSIAPLPFFLYLLLRDAKSVQAAPMPLSSIIKTDGVPIKADSTVAEKMSSRTAAFTVKKAVIGIVAGVAVCGGVIGSVYFAGHKDSDGQTEVQQESKVQAQTEAQRESEAQTEVPTENSTETAQETQIAETADAKWKQAYINYADELGSNRNGYAVLKVSGSDIPLLVVMPDVFDRTVDTTGWQQWGFATEEEFIKASNLIQQITEDSCIYPGAYPFKLFYYDTSTDEVKRILHSEGNNVTGTSDMLPLYIDASMYLTYQPDKEQVAIDVSGNGKWLAVYSVNTETGNLYEENVYSDVDAVYRKEIIYYRKINQALENVGAVQK